MTGVQTCALPILPTTEETPTDSGVASLPAEPEAQPNLVTQTYDDGSQLTYDKDTGLPVSGIDTEGAKFDVTDGIGSYVDTGAPLGGTPETNFGGELANPEDVQKLLDYNANVGSTTPKISTGGGSTSGLTPAQIAAMTGIGALAAKGLTMPSVPKVGYQGTPLQYTAERIPGMGVKYTPKLAAGGGLMSLDLDPSSSVQMYAAGGETESDSSLAAAMKAGYGQNVGIANQMNHLIGRGMSPEEAKQLIQQGVNVYTFSHGGKPASSMGGGEIYRAAEKAGIGTDNASLNRIVDLINNGMSINQAVSMVSSSKAMGGGISDLGSYTHATGGRMLKGPGDGMSDSIPASIDGKRPARLATDEFVVPADVVSHLGNGSSDAGAKVLYEMMDKVRKARTGTAKQGKQINPKKYLPK